MITTNLSYQHRQSQSFERVILESKDTLRSSKELAQQFLTRTRGDQTEATHLALCHVRALFPEFVPRKDIGSPAERLYCRLQKAIGTQANVKWNSHPNK